MRNVSLERLMVWSIRAFQEKMMSTGRNAEIRNISTQEGTGSKATQGVPEGYVYEEGEAQA